MDDNMCLYDNDDVDLDIVIYTPSKWLKYKDDKANFANIINRTEVS